jgi:carbon monoxide dehydrogenase subunit G
MKINLNGSFDIDSSLSNAFAFLTDPKRLSTCVSDLKETKFIDSHTFETSLIVKIGPINGNFYSKCNISSAAPDTVNIKIDGTGTASTMHLVISLKLNKKTENVTSVSWEANAEITGLVSGLGETILRELSNSKIAEIINALKNNITK